MATFQNQARAEAQKNIEQALAMVKEAQDSLRRLDRFGLEPADGTILVFDKTFADDDVVTLNYRRPRTLVDQMFNEGTGSPVYRYVAISTNGRWYTTARDGKIFTWSTLAEFIDDSPCWKVTGLAEIVDVTTDESQAFPAPSGAAISPAQRRAAVAILTKNRKTDLSNGKLLSELLAAIGVR